MPFLWEKLIRPALFRLDAETAHEVGMAALRNGAARPFYTNDGSPTCFGPIERFGIKFENPLGIAAGFDKNAVAVNQLSRLGFGFVEVGTVTYRPQTGNPKPRLFRLPNDEALINRLGFNNEGAEIIAGRLKELKRRGVVGVNIGKNKDVPMEEAAENYLAAFDLVQPVADYVAVNISSPNTPGLRRLQGPESLAGLLSALRQRDRELAEKPLLVKIAPDLGEAEIESAVGICLEYGVAGIIATNTTVSREGLRTAGVTRFGEGGLSGRPLFERSTEVVAAVYRYSKGRIPIIGVGGIFSADDAFEKIAAGASLIQSYTGFVYGGPSFASTVVEGLARILEQRGFSTLDEAVGSADR
ncbi:MAG: quinone-dependent dihydroorotate dehydrogenase [Pyrinomonadaceae bacterium]